MSTFCQKTKGSPPAFTQQELQQPYPNGILPANLPSMNGGLASEDWVTKHIKSLEDSDRLPKSIKMDTLQSNMFNSPETAYPLSEYVEKDNKFINSIKAEYCHYEGRYLFCLNSFLDSIANTSLGTSTDVTIQQKLANTREFNQKLTLLTQIVNGISKQKYTAAQEYNNQINAVNTDLKKRQERLLKQNEILQKETASADLNKKMVEYTTEKNKANQNLLSLYGVLNIVALAMVFYIART